MKNYRSFNYILGRSLRFRSGSLCPPFAHAHCRQRTVGNSGVPSAAAFSPTDVHGWGTDVFGKSLSQTPLMALHVTQEMATRMHKSRERRVNNFLKRKRRQAYWFAANAAHGFLWSIAFVKVYSLKANPVIGKERRPFFATKFLAGLSKSAWQTKNLFTFFPIFLPNFDFQIK